MKAAGYAVMGAVLGAAGCVIAAHGAVQPTAYGQLDLFSTAFATVRADYVDPVPDDRLVSAAIQGMVSGLDPHSGYMDAKDFGGEFQVRTQGRFGGVGIEVSPDAGLIKVISAMDGMPAAAAGIKPQDHITAVNGMAVAGRKFNDAIDSMRGAVGSKVVLTIAREGEKQPFDVTLTRASVPFEAVTHHREGDIGYVRLPGFNEQTAEELEQAVRALKKEIGPGIRGYVLDLRNNPGGLLDQAIQVSDDFLNAGEIVSTRGRAPEDTQRYDAKEGDIADGKPVVVLVNAGTASAAEIVSGALQDHRRATIIGMTSFGKGSVQTIIALGKDRGALRLTTARYYTPSGHSIQAQGIIPDIQVAQGDEVPKSERYSEAGLPGHLAGEPVPAARLNAPVIYAAPGKKYGDFQLAYALDLLRGKMTVASVTKNTPG